MLKGDLATWVDHRICVVLEGILAQVPEPTVTQRGVLRKTRIQEWAHPDTWTWSVHSIKVLNDKARRHSLPIDVVTFIDPEVADQAGEWMMKYDVLFSTCTYYDFKWFCESVIWRPDLHLIVDSEPDRLQHYGAKGYQSAWGGNF